VVAGRRQGRRAGGAAGQAPLPVKIGKITLQGGDIRFSDNFIKPNYSANLKKIGGTISGLSSAADSVASIDLRGSYDNIAPLTVSGQLNPLVGHSLSRSAGRHQGDRDDLAVAVLGQVRRLRDRERQDVAVCQVQDREPAADAENRVFLDQLTFGEPVDSPDATKLPVTLAVALLKNRNGEIDINLPISGLAQ
jgi:hypothetical protein